jgi:hypothetical protein
VFLIPYGEFGNRVISFVNARYFAAATGISRIFCDPKWAGLEMLPFPIGASFRARDGVEISIARDRFHTPYPESLILSSNFYFSPSVCEDWSWRDVRDGMSDFLLRQFKPMAFSERELVIVLRGGTGMWGPGKFCPAYMQAPCQFFLDIMKNSSQTWVFGGDGSPCKDIAVEAGGRWIPWDPIEGTRYMLYARNVAWARTSRSHAVIALTPVFQRFWMFDIETEKHEPFWWRGFKPYEFGEGYDCVASSEYRRIGSPWIPTEQQIQQVRNGSCEFKAIRPP